MRAIIPILALFYAVNGCNGAPSDFQKVAQGLFHAAVQKDSVQLSRAIADTLVLRDLALLETESPGILQRAAVELEVDNIGEIWGDSAYVFFQPITSSGDRGLGMGFVRHGNVWKVYYAGLTGSDLLSTHRGKR